MLTQAWERCRCYLLHVGSLGFVPYLCMLLPPLRFYLYLCLGSPLANPCLSMIRKHLSLGKLNHAQSIFTTWPLQFESCPVWDVLWTVLRCFLQAKPCLLMYCLHWNSSRVKVCCTIQLFGAGSVGRICLGSLLVSAWYWTLISYLDVLSVIVSYLCITAAFFLQSNCISVVSTDVLVSLISQCRASGRAFKSHFHCYQCQLLVLAG